MFTRGSPWFGMVDETWFGARLWRGDLRLMLSEISQKDMTIHSTVKCLDMGLLCHEKQIGSPFLWKNLIFVEKSHFCGNISFLWKNPIFVEKNNFCGKIGSPLLFFTGSRSSVPVPSPRWESGNPLWDDSSVVNVAPPEFLVLKRWYYGFMMIYVRSLNVDIMLI